MLEKRQLVMDKQEEIVRADDPTVSFMGDGEEFAILNDVWNDLGRPLQITVTIEPGDLLNG